MSDSPDYLYQEIAEAIRRQIVTGELAPGERLPAVRALAKEWSCTPGTVARAYRALNGEGLLVSHRGKGTRVADHMLQPDSGFPREGGVDKLRWAMLVNRAEQFLLEAATSGFSTGEAQAALSVAVSRWMAMRDAGDGTLRTTDDKQGVLRFSGSHDLLVEILADLVREAEPRVDMELTFNGSLGGLMALLRRDADIAGTHLWEEESDTYNERTVRRLFPGEEVVLLTLAHRQLGLIYDRKRVGDLTGLEDAVQRELRLANRQRGSGTRVWLDAQLRRLGADVSRVPGYDTALATHMAVARKVASGEADVALGIYGAAAALGLDFLSLTRERYDLAFLKSSLGYQPLQLLMNLMSEMETRKALAAPGGYDLSETGMLHTIGEVSS